MNVTMKNDLDYVDTYELSVVSKNNSDLLKIPLTGDFFQMVILTS